VNHGADLDFRDETRRSILSRAAQHNVYDVIHLGLNGAEIGGQHWMDTFVICRSIKAGQQSNRTVQTEVMLGTTC